MRSKPASARGTSRLAAMSRPVALTIPQPCHESWATMTPTAQGRHCAACNKVVLDFTQKTDAEILAALKQASAPCGRFRADQLNRTMVAPVAPTPRWRTWLAAAATVWGLRETATQTVQAQRPAPVRSAVASVAPLAVRSPRLEPLSGKAALRGRVVGVNAAGLANATVQLTNTSIHAVTAADGSFVLALPNNVETIVVFTVSAPGYHTLQMAVLLESELLQSLVIELQSAIQNETQIVLGGISAVRVVDIKPAIVRSTDLWEAVRRATSRNP